MPGDGGEGEGAEEIIKILVATDSHLGYLERDPVRGMDSFAAFEETLLLAKEKGVDFVLLGGDLFHDNKPSRRTLFRTMDILRKHCMGDEPVSFQILTNEKTHFPDHPGHPWANYRDPFYSVGLPVFSIHGNHDDPVREVGAVESDPPLAALDLLHKANLVNYFGKSSEVDHIVVRPIILQKGETTLALYGLGSMRDERLTRLWLNNKVMFAKPPENADLLPFNLFVLHQNRECRGKGKNFIKETMLPEWLDLVIWGHEHESRDVEESLQGTFRILQPGSTVATSLVAGEARKKHVALLQVRGQQFKLDRIPLTQVRPFRMESIALRDFDDLDPADPKLEKAMNAHLSRIVKDMVKEMHREDGAAQEPPEGQTYLLTHREQVLIRINVDYTEFQTINNNRFGSSFIGTVANPSDILNFKKQAKTRAGQQTSEGGGATQTTRSSRGPIPPDRDVNVRDLVKETLQATDAKLELISELGLNEALEKFVDQEEVHAISDEVNSVLTERQRTLKASQGPSSAKEIEGIVKQMTQTEKDMAEKEERKRMAQAILSQGQADSEGAQEARPAAKSGADGGDDADHMDDGAASDDGLRAKRRAQGSKGATVAPKRGGTKKAAQPTIMDSWTKRASEGAGGSDSDSGRNLVQRSSARQIAPRASSRNAAAGQDAEYIGGSSEEDNESEPAQVLQTKRSAAPRRASRASKTIQSDTFMGSSDEDKQDEEDADGDGSASSSGLSELDYGKGKGKKRGKPASKPKGKAPAKKRPAAAAAASATPAAKKKRAIPTSLMSSVSSSKKQAESVLNDEEQLFSNQWGEY